MSRRSEKHVKRILKVFQERGWTPSEDRLEGVELGWILDAILTDSAADVAADMADHIESSNGSYRHWLPKDEP